MKEPVQPFDWQRILLDQFDWTYLGEVALRTVFMFIVLLSALAVSGKREVRQLSIYELVLLIGLGSAAGDPMFYDDVPLGSAVVVFVVMMSCYKLTTYLSDRNQAIKKMLEGKPVYVVEDGCILVDKLDKQDVGIDELFSDLRVAGVEHLGQVRIVILEANGQFSIFQFEPDAVRPGLPILPKVLGQHTKSISKPGAYACCTCGNVQSFPHPVSQQTCSRCNQSVWVEAISSVSK